MNVFKTLTTCLCMLIATIPLSAGTQIIRNVDYETGPHFGLKIAVDGDLMLVGGLGYDGTPDPYPTIRTPSAVIFRKQNGTWVEHLQINGNQDEWPTGFRGMDLASSHVMIHSVSRSPQGEPQNEILTYRYDGNRFLQGNTLPLPEYDFIQIKSEVKISGDYAAFLGIDAITVFFYDGARWSQIQQLPYPMHSKTLQANIDHIALDGNLLVLSDTMGADQNYEAGRVFIYKRELGNYPANPNWVLESPPDTSRFGWAISAKGNRILIGSDRFFNPGKAFLYEFVNGSWEYTTFQLEPDDTSRFGDSVALGEHNLIIGAAGVFSSTAYLFTETENGWEKQEYDDCIDQEDSSMGLGVAITNGTAVIGVQGQENQNAHSGAVIAWDIAPEISLGRLVSGAAQPGNQYGKSVAVNDDFAIVGEPSFDDNRGRVELFRYDDGDWERMETSIQTSGDSSSVSARIGSSVAISGQYAAIGTPAYNNWGGVIFLKQSGDVWNEIPNSFVQRPDDDQNQSFGSSMAMKGSRLIVGDPARTIGSNTVGGAYIFERRFDSWTRFPVLTPSINHNDQRFGASVAISGNYAVVGAPQEDHSPTGCTGKCSEPRGAVYIYERQEISQNGNTTTVWTEIDKLTLDPNTYEFFGHGVAIEGTTIVASAEYQSKSQDRGEVFTFVLDESGNQWQQQGPPIQGPPGLSPTQFGVSMSFSEGVLMIGSPKEGSNGSAYVYRQTAEGAWQQQSRIEHPSDASGLGTSAGLGQAVAVSDGRILIGALAEASSQGAVYFHEVPTFWSLEQELPRMGPTPLDYGSVSDMSDDYIVVGNPEMQFLNERGSVFIYEKDTCNNWNISHTAQSVDSFPNDRFGRSVAVSGDRVVVGGSGLASVLTKTPSGWIEEALPISDPRIGNSIDIDGSSIVVAAAGAFGDATSPVYVYTYDNGTWVQEAEILTSGLSENHYGFGASVSISGDYIAVGSPHEWSNRGRVYIFKRNRDVGYGHPARWEQTFSGIGTSLPNQRHGWEVELEGSVLVAKGQFLVIIYERLDPNSEEWTGVSGDVFGQLGYYPDLLALSGNLIMIGGPDQDNPDNKEGAVYILKKTGESWAQFEVTQPDWMPSTYSRFGHGLSLYNGKAVICSQIRQAAYLFSYIPESVEQ